MEQMLFETREAFRAWLEENCQTSKGIWLIFGKSGGPKTLKANEALEEALCFGWIDSQLKSYDDKSYVKYFSRRAKQTEWSDKNKALVHALEKQGRMSDYGRQAIEEAKHNGTFEAKKRPVVGEEQIETLTKLLISTEPAYTNFLNMSPSVRRIYTALYFDAKSEQTKTKRLDKIIERLNLNLKPM